MDLTQLSQMVGWLDEEHRRDREELARLDQRLQTMTVDAQEQSRRIQDLEGRLASTQAQLSRFAQIDQALQQLKNEVVLLLNKEAEARMQFEREAERVRLAEREVVARSLAELRKELSRIGKLEEEIVGRQAEDQRLSEMLMAQRVSINNVSKDLDDRTRSLPYVMEQRAQDNKRIAQLQAELVEVFKRTDMVPGKLSLLEERIQRTEREIQRLQPVPDTVKREQQAFVEAQRLADADRTRQLNQWGEQFAQQCKMIEAQGVRLRDYTLQYESSQRSMQALEEFRQTMSREQKQISELQRLGEERQRKELSAWEADNEQRWKKEMMRWDYSQSEQQKINQKLEERFPPLEQKVKWLQTQNDLLWRLHEVMATQQFQDAQRMVQTLDKAVEERSKQPE